MKPPPRRDVLVNQRIQTVSIDRRASKALNDERVVARLKGRFDARTEVFVVTVDIIVHGDFVSERSVFVDCHESNDGIELSVQTARRPGNKDRRVVGGESIAIRCVGSESTYIRLFSQEEFKGFVGTGSIASVTTFDVSVVAFF